jgi:hypothetical protein
MYLAVKPKVSEKGVLLDQPLQYQPNDKERQRYKNLMSDFNTAQSIRDTTYSEFSSSSSDVEEDIITFKNKMVKRFNNVIPQPVDDPNQAWRANTVRPLTRNKSISIIAHLTNSILYPNVLAQNEDSVVDKDMSNVMRDAVEWVGEQSKYDDFMIKVCYELCYSPAVICEQGYRKVMRQIKEIQDDGKWKFKDIEDEEYNGYFNEVVPIEELYIENIYEPDIQKQGFLIRVKAITYEQAKAKYGDSKNWDYIRPGYINYFDDETGAFYEQYDEQLRDRLVQEVIYYNRYADLELRCVNGVLMDDPDRPLQRKDKKYCYAKTGYELFNTKFFYFMPLVAKLMPDQDVIDTLYNMIVDGTYLQTFPPVAIFGRDDIDSSVMQPGNTVAFSDVNSKMMPLSTGANMTQAMNVLNKVEASASESSQDPLQAGQSQGGTQTKYEIHRLEINAQTVLGLAGKALSSLVYDFGQLLVGCICQYMPIAEINEVVGDSTTLKFPKLFIPKGKGSNEDRMIDFTNEMPESPEEEENMSFELLRTKTEKGYSITKVNPEAFRRMKYLIKISPDFSSTATKFAKKLQLYDRAIANPMADQEVVTKELLFGAYVPGEEDKYMRKAEKNEIANMMTQNNLNKKTAVTQIATPTADEGLM